MRRLASFIVLALVAAACGSADGVPDSSSATTLAGGTGEQTPIVIPGAVDRSGSSRAAHGDPLRL